MLTRPFLREVLLEDFCSVATAQQFLSQSSEHAVYLATIQQAKHLQSNRNHAMGFSPSRNLFARYSTEVCAVSTSHACHVSIPSAMQPVNSDSSIRKRKPSRSCSSANVAVWLGLLLRKAPKKKLCWRTVFMSPLIPPIKPPLLSASVGAAVCCCAMAAAVDDAFAAASACESTTHGVLLQKCTH